MYLLVWAIFTAYMMIAALRVNAVVLAVFVAADPDVRPAGHRRMDGQGAWVDLTKVGGYVGLLTALAAWYASFAVVTNSTFKKVVLPVGPRAESLRLNPRALPGGVTSTAAGVCEERS